MELNLAPADYERLQAVARCVGPRRQEALLRPHDLSAPTYARTAAGAGVCGF